MISGGKSLINDETKCSDSLCVSVLIKDCVLAIPFPYVSNVSMGQEARFNKHLIFKYLLRMPSLQNYGKLISAISKLPGQL